MGHHFHRENKRKRGIAGYFLAGLAGAACMLALTAFPSHGENVTAGERVLNETSSSQAAFSVLPHSSPTEEEDRTAPWYLRLVNKDHPLPPDFSVETVEAGEGRFDSRAADALSQMLSDMESQGLSPLVCSSFRTWEDQDSLYQTEVESHLEQGYSQEEAEQEAARWVVPAGTSEHELGLAADIVASDYQMLEEEQENTPEQQWLMAHCADYGFILRYPKDKTDITGVGYEPWHYRYVGAAAAQEITEQGLCLEEYWSAHFLQNGNS